MGAHCCRQICWLQTDFWFVLANPEEPTTRSNLYEKGLGILIWLTFAVAGIVALYLLSFWAGD
jgi:hypothetical protein